jgi:hypothetical protein
VAGIVELPQTLTDGRAIAGFEREQSIANILHGIVVALAEQRFAVAVSAAVILNSVGGVRSGFRKLERGEAMTGLAPPHLGPAGEALGVVEEQAITAGAGEGLHSRFAGR